MDPQIPLQQAAENIAVAMLVGLLIGLDRERSEERDQLPRLGGVRTFPLISLLGAVSSLLHPIMGPWPMVLSFIAVAAVITVAYARTSKRDVGATTEMAALLTYALGLLAGSGALLVAGVVGVIAAVLLVAKLKLEAFSHAITQTEVTSTLELAVISAIILPLLPNGGYGPYDALNPFEIWLVAVLVSAISFGGFVAVRLWGARKGLLVTAFIGAIVSSTAVTLAMAGRSRDDAAAARIPAAGAVMASTLMCVRVFVLAAIFGPSLLRTLWLPLAAMTVVGALASLLLFRGAKEPGEATAAKLGNPSRLTTALAFAAIFAIVNLLVPFAKRTFGGSGVLVASAVSGIADVAAIAIALAQEARAERFGVLVLAIVVASVVNTWVKGGIAMVAGRGRFRFYVALPLLLMGLVGLGTALIVRSWGSVSQ